MPRNPKIRVTKNDREEYARLVRNTQAKIRRSAEKFGVDLKNEIQLPKLEDIKTREQFNELKEKAKSFTNRHNTKYQFVKNQYGVVASKREINEIKRNTKLAQRLADKEIKAVEKKPVFVAGKEVTTVGQEMKQMAKPQAGKITRPKDFDFNKVRDERRLKDLEERMKDRAKPGFYNKKKELLRDNVVKMLEHSANSDANEMADIIRNIPADDFYEIYLQNTEFQFKEFYPKEHMGEGILDEHVQQMEYYLQRYFAGNMNMDLKIFE